jgi:hypothetical protein
MFESARSQGSPLILLSPDSFTHVRTLAVIVESSPVAQRGLRRLADPPTTCARFALLPEASVGRSRFSPTPAPVVSQMVIQRLREDHVVVQEIQL